MEFHIGEQSSFRAFIVELYMYIFENMNFIYTVYNFVV